MTPLAHRSPVPQSSRRTDSSTGNGHADGVRALRCCDSVDLIRGGTMAGPWPTQQVGSKGEDVRTVQYLLDVHGPAIAVDGVFGPGTKTAVQSFQSGHGLTADGIVGNATWDKLIVTVASGASGAAARAVQGQLATQGWRVAVDGAVGPATQRGGGAAPPPPPPPPPPGGGPPP